MFAILGDIEFTVAGGISAMEHGGTADWAEHSRIQGKPLLEWTGEGLDTCTISIELHPLLGDPEARLRALHQAKAQHEPLPFVMGNGDYLGAYVITDINTTLRRSTALGQTTAGVAQLSLKEYTGAVTRKVNRPGLLNPQLLGTPGAGNGSPGLQSKLLAPPSTTQLMIGHAKTASNVLRAGQNLYETVKHGNAATILGRVPQLLGVTARALEPLQGLKIAAGLMADGADLSRLAEDVLASVTGARSSLHPVDLSNIVERFAASKASVDTALGTLDGASARLAGFAAQVVTRRA